MADQQTTPWWRRIFHGRDERAEGARDALTALAMKFDDEAESYRRKCKDTRAEFYADMASAIRNHRDWAIVRATHGR